MKKPNLPAISFAIAWVVSMAFNAGLATKPVEVRVDTILVEDVIEDALTEWELIQMAFAEQESEYRPKVVGDSGNAWGVLQQWNSNALEANRIIGDSVYCHQDSFDPVKAYSIFNIIQGRHNPTQTLKGAAEVHNPKAGDWYLDEVEICLEMARKRERIRNAIIKKR